VRLIRSKGVGVYFISQSPLDIPEDVLGQLGNRVQHALRAFTPKDQKAVKAAAETFRPNPKLKVAEVITELEVGEALVSLLDEKGSPTPVERALVVPPGVRLGPVTDAERKKILQDSPVAGHYEKAVDRESAYEKLKNRAEKTAEAAPKAGSAAAQQPSVGGMLGDLLLGSTGPRGGRREGLLEVAAKSATRQATSRLVRGVLGSLLGGRR
jgi:DNA helicase HerA-like ATPase